MINVTLDNVKTSSVKFDESPVIRQICQSFPQPNIRIYPDPSFRDLLLGLAPSL